MKIYKIISILILISFTLPLFAAPESSGKLAGTETAFIGTSYANIGLMDSNFNFFEIVSIKTNIPFDIIGLYNISVKAGYHFDNFMDLRLALGYTGFYLNEAQMLTGIANGLTAKSGITINSLNLNIKGQKIYFALMVPIYGFNLHSNIALYFLDKATPYSKATLGLEKTFFNNKLSVFANGGLFFNLPLSDANAEAKSIYYNLTVTDLYADGGIRFYVSDHFNIDLGFIYPGIKMPLGNDPDTGEAKELNLPVLPVFNIAYRF